VLLSPIFTHSYSVTSTFHHLRADCLGTRQVISNMSAAQRSEKEKMLAGELYLAFDDELLQERQKAKELLSKYNQMHQVL